MLGRCQSSLVMAGVLARVEPLPTPGTCGRDSSKEGREILGKRVDGEVWMVRREMQNERVWSTQKLGRTGLKLMSFFGIFGGGRTG